MVFGQIYENIMWEFFFFNNFDWRNSLVLLSFQVGKRESKRLRGRF